MFNKGPHVQIDLTIHVNVREPPIGADGYGMLKKTCHFELHVKKNTCVEEAFYETFLRAKELLETAMKEDKKG
jgi:hypothetical protein